MSVKPICYLWDFILTDLRNGHDVTNVTVCSRAAEKKASLYDQSAIDQLEAEIAQQRSNATQIAKDALDKARERNDEIDSLRAEIARLQK
jgi:hypothetical protein